MSSEPSREMMLAASCCRWPPTPARAAAVQRAMSKDLDWDRLLTLVDRHRIEGLVWAGLNHAGVALPERFGKSLAARAGTIAISNLRNAAEEARLCRQFEAAGIELIFLKGTSGGLLAYGSLALKRAWDIDILVSGPDLESAAALLVTLGYERRAPPPDLSAGGFRRWRRHAKEMLWVNAALGTAVELHFALVDNPYLLSNVGMSSPRQMVSHGDALTLPTLATEELFSYLCVHGTVHMWVRLKWLADLAALIENNGLDCEQLYRASLRLGAGRCGAVALLLCHRFFRLALPRKLQAELRSDQAVTVLEHSALAAIKRCEMRPDGRESAGEMLGLMAALLLAKPDLRYVLAELSYRLFFPYSARHLAIWPAFWPILTFFQLPRFVLKRMRLKRAVRRTQRM